MKKTRIVVIGVYFGKFPNYMDLWLKSCYLNKDIDFKVVTDSKEYKSTHNVEFINMSITEFANLARKKLKMDICLNQPYKCCDYKPVYGVILSNYIDKYDFWGHCDFDLIFGDIRSFLIDDIFNKYDKVLPLGHLSFYRNTEEVNSRYLLDGGKSYRDAFTTKEICFFDEYDGMIKKYQLYNFSFYDKRVFADISFRHERFQLPSYDENYDNQVFCWENGKVFRKYEVDGKIECEEFIYIHFQKRKNMTVHFKNIDKVNEFYITNTGFYEKKDDVINDAVFNKYNKYRCYFYEKYESIHFIIKKYYSRIKNRMGGNHE